METSYTFENEAIIHDCISPSATEQLCRNYEALKWSGEGTKNDDTMGSKFLM